MVFRMLALVGLLVGLAFGVQAQDVSDADRTAIRDIIQSQVDAFRRDDGDAAFGYASPSIRGMFGSSEIFMDMVRQGYQPAARRHLAHQRLLSAGARRTPGLISRQKTPS